jgi:hypothetical protein
MLFCHYSYLGVSNTSHPMVMKDKKIIMFVLSLLGK